MITHRLLLWMVYLYCCATASDMFNQEEPESVADQIAIRAQRDISMNIPIDKVSSFGISLNEFMFNDQGYTDDTVGSITSVLDSGVTTFMIDFYWNEFTSRWQLCPAPFPSNVTNNLDAVAYLNWEGSSYTCQVNTTIDSLMANINSYIRSTNTNLDASMLNILVNLKDIRMPRSNTTTSSSFDNNGFKESTSQFVNVNSSLLLIQDTDLYNTVGNIQSSIFTPSQLASIQAQQHSLSPDPTGFYNSSSQFLPTLNEYLLMAFKRANVFIASNQLGKNSTYNLSSTDNTTFFMSNSLLDLVSISNSSVSDQCQSLIDFNSTRGLSPPDTLSLFNNISLTTKFRFVIDDKNDPFTNDTIRRFMNCGLSPILNASSSTYYFAGNNHDGNSTDPSQSLSWTSAVTLHPSLSESTLANNPTSTPSSSWVSTNSSVSSSKLVMSIAVINSMLPQALWTWSIGQPDVPTDPDQNTNTTDADDSRFSANQVAFSCGALTRSGIVVSNCYLSYPYACQNTSDPNDWIVNANDAKTYFSSYLQSDCPAGYRFSIPNSNIELLSLLNHVNDVKQKATGTTNQATSTSGNEEFPIWVDLNDITVPQCFVTGGPYASCPYQKTVTYSTLVRMIAPSAVVALVVLVLIFLERFVRVNSISSNRKRYWKKMIGEYTNEHAYEGVPS